MILSKTCYKYEQNLLKFLKRDLFTVQKGLVRFLSRLWITGFWVIYHLKKNTQNPVRNIQRILSRTCFWKFGEVNIFIFEPDWLRVQSNKIFKNKVQFLKINILKRITFVHTLKKNSHFFRIKIRQHYSKQNWYKILNEIPKNS